MSSYAQNKFILNGTNSKVQSINHQFVTLQVAFMVELFLSRGSQTFYLCLLEEYDLDDTQWPSLSTFLTTTNGQVINKAEGLCDPCISRLVSKLVQFWKSSHNILL